MRNKDKISDVQLLQKEKKRLKEICAMQEKKLKGHVKALRNDSFEMIIRSILPFEASTKNKIIGGLELINKILFSPLFGISSGKEGKSHKLNLLKLLQTVMIAFSIKFFRKLFRKKKESPV